MRFQHRLWSPGPGFKRGLSALLLIRLWVSENLLKAQFPHLQNGGHNQSDLIEFLQINKIHIKALAWASQIIVNIVSRS